MRLRFTVLAAVSLGALVGCGTDPQAVAAHSSPVAQTAPSGLALAPLEIRSGRKTRRFMVEVARTDAEQAQGLMFRERLGANEGMIFPFATPRVAGFWMKNTLIPLDMLFIRADGTIARVAANTVPRSLETVSSGEPVSAVLELRGGRAAELGIKAGDQVSWGDRGAPTQ